MRAAIFGSAAFLLMAYGAQAEPLRETDQPAPAKQPTIKGNPLDWVTNVDYPSAAARERREGRAGYRLTIDPSGRVSNCEITSSTGHDDLDSETCRVLRRRARFVKETDGKEPRYFNSIYSWNLPR